MAAERAYEVVDCQTGVRVNGKPMTLRHAHAYADRLDNAYGAVRYVVRRVAAP